MFSDQPNFYNPSSDHQNPPPLFTLQDSPFFDQQKAPLPFISHQLPLQNIMILPSPEEKQVRPSITRLRSLGTIPRRRPGKKDRHSKICTAQGIRDRRMRLSVQIARKFFDLQDMLGYDKASKTIEWLFANSKKAINELIKNHPQYEDDGEEGEEENPKGGCKPDVLRVALREKARARARWRTREKMMIRIFEGSGSYNGTKPSNPSYNEYVLDQKLGFSNGGGDDQQETSLNNQERVSNVYGDVGTIEKLLGSSSMSCPSSSCQNRAVMDSDMDPSSGFMAFFGSWEVLNNERTNEVTCTVVNDQDALGENPSSVYSATR